MSIAEEFPRIEFSMGFVYATPSDYSAGVVVRVRDEDEAAAALLSPLAARALAHQLLKAARWAEGDRT